MCTSGSDSLFWESFWKFKKIVRPSTELQSQVQRGGGDEIFNPSNRKNQKIVFIKYLKNSHKELIFIILAYINDIPEEGPRTPPPSSY